MGIADAGINLCSLQIYIPLDLSPHPRMRKEPDVNYTFLAIRKSHMEGAARNIAQHESETAQSKGKPVHENVLDYYPTGGDYDRY